MKSLILIAAIIGCSLAEPAPQFPYNQYNQYNQGRYNPGQYDPFNRFNNNKYPYNQFNQGRFRQQFYSTPAPFSQPKFASTFKPFDAVEATPAPVVASAASAQAYADGRQYNYRASEEANAQTLRLDNDQTPDGGFQYSYETSNGIAAQAVGSPRNLGGVPPNVPTVVQGSYSWVAPEGKVISISYVADENGYRAVGDSIPTPPPIPEAILRSIEYNRQYESAK